MLLNERRDPILVKGCGLFLSPKISFSKTETAAAGASNYKKVIIIVINFSILLKNLLQTHLKLLQKRIIRKATEAIMFLLVKKISNN